MGTLGKHGRAKSIGGLATREVCEMRERWVKMGRLVTIGGLVIIKGFLCIGPVLSPGV